MIEKDLRAELLSDSNISAIISDRFFLKAPIDKQTLPFCTYHRQVKTRDMVSVKNRFQIYVFHQDTELLENLSDLIINNLDGKKILNGNEYYSNSLIGQSDSRVKLDDGFFWNLLTFEFKNTI